MIEFNTHRLDNGLRLIYHFDATTKMVALNILYDVGSRDEVIGKTGFAHLFEHLMFGGSKNIPDFDAPLQVAGGESNAWTSDDVTNFYEILPAHNVETAFWLESDRLNELAFSQHSLDVQKRVVIEEFKQRCLNVPYGDVSHIIRSNAFKRHTYRWPVIGEKVSDIENVSLESVRDFFYSHYAPNNAILCISGNIQFGKALGLTEKWMSKIPKRTIRCHKNIEEPRQTEKRIIKFGKDAPQNLLVKAYHMCGRLDADYQASDILSDILSNGSSSRFFRNVLLETDVFTDLDASIWGTIDPGLFVIRGRLRHGIEFERADAVVEDELQKLLGDGVSQYEVDKFVNKFESKNCFENISYSEKASKLCYYELLGDANGINTEIELYRRLDAEKVNRVAKKIFREDNQVCLYYGPNA